MRGTIRDAAGRFASAKPPLSCASCDANADILPEFKVYMRYTGQGWEIPDRADAAAGRKP